MQAKSTDIAFSLLLTCCLALSLASCQNSSWHLAAGKKGGTVELCLSNGDECPQPGGVSPARFPFIAGTTARQRARVGRRAGKSDNRRQYKRHGHLRGAA